MRSIAEQCKLAHDVAHQMGMLSTLEKNQALSKMAEALLVHAPFIISENKRDLALSRKAQVSPALLDRLTITDERLQEMADSLLQIVALKDPIGDVMSGWRQPNGLQIQKVRVPLGVIGIIYEARPNVTVDAIALCVKTGNCVVLRGSKSAQHSNAAITTILKDSLKDSAFPMDGIQLLDNVSREGVVELCRMNEYLDMVIPRGGIELIQTVVKNATVPSIETGAGNCHVYVDRAADLVQAKAIVINAKVQRPSVCNSCETLLVHAEIAPRILPELLQELSEKGVEIRGCAQTKALFPSTVSATEQDWATEYLDLILAVKVVKDAADAISHIQRYSTKHTEVIVSTHYPTIELFVRSVDAAAVTVNASSRFTDGGEFGFGAEMGISTQKLHARGPMGLAELTTYKYVVFGNGQIR